ncbi:Beauvericin cluster-specific repressor BEA4 [Paramyrothecium foliicola]|nr:Beauvericin cluster-specific repressor BEA4 [Paramyrothecium foliicola]
MTSKWQPTLAVPNLKCPGYGTKYQWKNKHQISQHEPSSSPEEGRLIPLAAATTSNAIVRCHKHKLTSEPLVISPPSNGTFAYPATWFITPSPSPPLPLIPINDGSKLLISHYFGSVCKINSCYHSPADSLRTITQGLMSSSRLVFFCVLSMSAAHLSLIQPRSYDKSLVYLTEAISLLRLQLSNLFDKAITKAQREQGLDQTLMGIILIGISTSWHKSSGLGLEHIVGSRVLLQEYVCPRLYDGSILDRQKLGFFIGLQAYWETVASFLLDQDLEQLDYLQKSCVEMSADTIYVHPWTGISSMIWVLLAKAGCVARKRLRLLAEASCLSQAEYTAQMNQLLQQASTIEAQLLDYELPSASCIDNTFADHASIADLERIAQCCRLAALLELYRAFGSLWDTRSRLEISAVKSQIWQMEPEGVEPSDFYLDADIYSILTLRILRILRCISPNSSTRCLQPILLLIAGSNVSYKTAMVFPYTTVEDYGTPDSSFTPSNAVQAWRQFVYQRIARVERWVKLDSLRRMRMILTEVWTSTDALRSTEQDMLMDGETQCIHWIAIMEEKGLHFLF